MDLVTNDAANMSSQYPIEAEIKRTEQNNNTNECGYGYEVREPIEGSLPEKSIESPVPTINEHQNPISSDNSTEMETNFIIYYYYICGTDESSSSTNDERTPVKKRRKKTATSENNIAVPETPSPKQCYTLRKTNADNEKFLWCDVRSVLYTKENMSLFSYKKEFKNVEYMNMDCSKRGKAYDMITINTVPKAYHSKITISTEKKKDLLDLLCFIHESSHEFYRSLSCKNDVKDTAPDNDDDSDDE